MQDYRRRPASLGVLVALVLLLGSLVASTARADFYLASVTSSLPVNSVSDLTAACTAVNPNATVQAMYSANVRTAVDAFLVNQSATQVYVSAAFDTVKSRWNWEFNEMGVAEELQMAASEFVGGTLPSASAGPLVTYDRTQSGMLATDGTHDYKVLCYVQKMVAVPKADKKFPWWGILIIVLAVVVILAIVVVVVVCCCCRKQKTRYTDDDDESSFSGSSRSGSFSSRGSSSASGSASCTSSRSGRSGTSHTSSDSESASGSETSSASSRSTGRSGSTGSRTL